MKVGIPKEAPPEQRVAAVPETVSKLIKAGMRVLVQAGAGESAFVSNADYEKAGAQIVVDAAHLYDQVEILLKVNRPSLHEAELLRENTILIAPLAPLLHLNLVQTLNQRKIRVFSLDLLPRLARTQAMDILSSMSSIAGYKSIILAAQHLGKLFPMMMTAAGTIQPTKVVVVGAGVAGLQAIATARRLGAVVLAFDTRPAAGEQVKSLGADFVSLEVTHDKAEDGAGYAKEQSAEFYQKEQTILRSYLKEADVVVTTALIPGKRAPLLITEEMVKEMRPGSVIVDLGVEQGGNCALSEPGIILAKYGVTILGLLNLPATLPVHASQLYARNLFHFLTFIQAQLEKNEFDLSDEIVRSTLICHQGEIIHPALKQALQQTERISA